MVVVEPFPEREHPQQPEVGSAFARAGDAIGLVAPRVGGVAHEPVAEEPGRRAEADADRDALGPERGPDPGREREDVQRPRGLEEAEPGVPQDSVRQPTERPIVPGLEPRVEVPDEVPQQPVVVGEIGRTVAPVLPVVPDRVEPRPGERPAQAGEHEEPGERAAHGARAFVAPVDDPPMEPDRVAQAEREERQPQGEQGEPEIERRKAARDAGDPESPQPQRPDRIEPDPPHRVRDGASEYEHVHKYDSRGNARAPGKLGILLRA